MGKALRVFDILYKKLRLNQRVVGQKQKIEGNYPFRCKIDILKSICQEKESTYGSKIGEKSCK